MTLTPIIKSADPRFNHRAAQRAAEAVMKMDEEDARWFTTMVVDEILNADIEKNLRTLQRHLDQVVAKRIEVAKRALLNTTISKSGVSSEPVAYAQALALIEKQQKNPYQYGYQFQATQHPRDPHTGRFVTHVHHNPDAPALSGKQAQAMGIPEHDKVKGKVKGEYQHAYRQIADFLNTVHHSAPGGLGEHDVYLHIENKRSGDKHVKQLSGKPQPMRDWDPNTEKVTHVEARPKTLTLGGATFGLVNSLGHQMGPESVHSLNRADQGFKQFSDDWSQEGDLRNSNARLYNRVKSGSDFLVNVAPRGSKAQIAGRFGQFIGQHGEEAERVLGPASRKAAYRYRGTERKPDAQVLDQYERVVRFANRPGGQLSGEERAARQTEIKRRQSRAETAAVQRLRQEKNDPTATLSADQRKAIRQRISAEYEQQARPTGQPSTAALGAGRAVLVDYLEKRLPQKELYGLHLDAGHTPPSEGFLVNDKGQVVAQAVGYGDDHYLPFNLKNLKALKGGEYIRTRSVGGPTAEDIYTGLITGARRVTVVSRSGRYTVEFEPDFRGGRRYNDKARRMTKRYQQLLDSIQSESVPRVQSVDPHVRARITQRVRDQYPEPAYNKREQRDKIRSELDNYKNELETTVGDRDEFAAYVEDSIAHLPPRDQADARTQMMGDWDKHQEFWFRLNAQGYADALNALTEQFPYYIKADYRTRHEGEYRTAPDKGYVEPDRNRPTAARAGWHGTTVNRGEKFSASHADYQGARTARRAEAPAPAAAAEGEAPAKPAEGPRKIPVRTQVAEEAQQKQYKEAALALQQRLHTQANEEQRRNPILGMNREDAEKYFDNPRNVREFDDFMRANDYFRNDLTGSGDRDLIERYGNASGRIGRVPYTHELGLTNPDKPFSFEESAYKPGATKDQVNEEAVTLDQRTRPLSAEKNLSELSDGELSNEVNTLVNAHRALQEHPEMDVDQKKEILDFYGINPRHPSVEALIQPNQFRRHLQDIHRMRALNLNRSEADRREGVTRTITQAPERPEDTSQPERKSYLNRSIRWLDQASARYADEGDVDTSNELASVAVEMRRASRQPVITDDAMQTARAMMRDYQEQVMHGIRPERENQR